jgi:iron complex transport system substrate-binding protein
VTTARKSKASSIRQLGLAAATVVFTTLGVGCSVEAQQDSPESSQVRTVVHDLGTTEVPVDPQRIVATDETAAMALLAVGVVPDVVFTGFGSPIGDALLEDAGAQVIDVPPIGAPPVEDVLGAGPDLVVGSNYGDDTLYRAISGTVATVPMPYLAPWEDSLAFVAEMFDRQDEADRLRAMLESEIESLRSTVAANPMSLSVVMYASDILAVATASAPSSLIARSVGLDAPQLQRAESAEAASGPWTALSPELITEQNADIVAVLDEGVYSADRVRATGGFAETAGDSALNVNGDMWTAEHPFATYWLVKDLEAIAAGDVGAIGTEATALTRFDEFVRQTQ